MLALIKSELGASIAKSFESERSPIPPGDTE